MIKLLLCACLFNFSEILATSPNFPEVTIEQGVLRGQLRQTWNGRVFKSFSGIPYAQPPVGNLRFQSPVPASSWQGILNATNDSPICPQLNQLEGTLQAIGNEDCLYLNIYTPQIGNRKNHHLLPVMFFIHGGSFFSGSGNPFFYGPDILLDKDIVLVTINYRLGALGFISTEDEQLPGNWGLKDQNLALKWVKKNILNFGGNPDKITIFGQSAGSNSVHLHMLSPLSKDLFNAAIAQSGVVTMPWALHPKGQALTNAKRLAGYLNCSNESVREIIECVSKADANDIVLQYFKFTVIGNYPLVHFRPVIEPKVSGAFITEDPIEIIKSGKVANVPFVTGVTTEEGAIETSAIFTNSTLVEIINRDYENIAPLMFAYENHPNKNEITRKIRHFYFGDKAIDNSTMTEFTNSITDSWWFYPQAAAIHLHTTYTKSPVYYYVFGIHGRISFTQLFGDPNIDYGVSHFDEMFYLFSTELFPDYKPNNTEKRVNSIMSKLWTSTALTGNPTPTTGTLIKNKWEPTTGKDLSSYFFNTPDDIKMTKNMFQERIKFWKDLALDPRL